MASTVRPISRRFKGQPTMEGAGVRLHRQFGYHEVPLLDPFLLLDNFGSTEPADYVKGFPWHPHRGIQTVTYMLDGVTAHEDTLGNKGEIGPGEVQWMSAGSGIMHQEMPQRNEKRLAGLQLWVNLPRSRKMETPGYNGVTANAIPVLKGDDGSVIKVIAGTHEGASGPVQDEHAEPLYLDVTLRPNGSFHHPTRAGDTVFAHVLEGQGHFDPKGLPAIDEPSGPLYMPPLDAAASAWFAEGETAVYGPGDEVRIAAGPKGLRFILVSGKPLGEPVAWHGPIVMNTRDEIIEAVRDLRSGKFIRSKQVLNATPS